MGIGHHEELVPPPGEPEAVNALARLWRQSADELEDAAHRLTGIRGALGNMKGSTVTAASMRMGAAAGESSALAAVLREASSGLAKYAGELDQGKEASKKAAMADLMAHEEFERSSALECSLSSQLNALSAASSLPSTSFQNNAQVLSGDLVRARDGCSSAMADELAALRAWHEARRQVKDAAKVAMSSLVDINEYAASPISRAVVRNPLPWEANMSLDDYRNGYLTWAYSHLPGMAGHEDTLQAAVWAATALPDVVHAGRKSLVGAGRLATYAYLSRGGADSARLMEVLTKPGMLDQSAMAKRALSLLERLRVPSGPIDLARRGLLGSLEGRAAWSVGKSVFDAASKGGASRLSAVAKGAAAAGKAMGAIKVLGVAGSAAATASSLVNVASQGWPWDAVKKNGLGYVADVAELGFNASMTAFMVCPTPFTLGATVVTGALYAGLELWNHREDIGRLCKDGVRMVGDVIDGTKKAVGDVVNKGLETARNIGSWLNPFD